MSTEYRDAYCWYYGINQKACDKFDEIILQKLNGTYREESRQKYIPHFQFELESKKKKIVPVPLPTSAPTQNNTIQNIDRKKINKKESKKPQKKAKKAWVAKGNGAFVEYGNGNTHQLNPELNGLTFNIKAPEGVHPSTLLRASLRPYVNAQYARPPPQPEVKAHEIQFISTPSLAKRSQDVKGPYWVYWPSDESFPPEYKELENIVRPNK